MMSTSPITSDDEEDNGSTEGTERDKPRDYSQATMQSQVISSTALAQPSATYPSTSRSLTDAEALDDLADFISYHSEPNTPLQPPPLHYFPYETYRTNSAAEFDKTAYRQHMHQNQLQTTLQYSPESPAVPGTSILSGQPTPAPPSPKELPFQPPHSNPNGTSFRGHP